MSRVELVCLILTAAIVAGVGMPALVRVREQRRLVTCTNSLRKIGVGFYTYADMDPSSRLCSGLPDWLHDGCPDTFGWIADLRTHNFAFPSDLICPSNPLGVPDTYEDLVGRSESTSRSRLAPTSEGFIDAGVCANFEVSFVEPNDVSDSGEWPGGSVHRISATEQLVRQGLTSNYAASWFLVRTGHSTRESEDGAISTRPGLSARDRAATVGPLRSTVIDRSSTPSSLIPLLGDAAPTNRSVSQLTAAGLVSPERSAARTLSGVCSYYSSRRDVMVAMPPGTMIRPVEHEDPEQWKHRPFCKDAAPTAALPRGNAGMDGKLWLSDLRGWKPVHPMSGGTLTVLMADASIKTLRDLNGDGLINPGFDVQITDSRTGYADNTTEVFAGSMYTLGELNHHYVAKNVFE